MRIQKIILGLLLCGLTSFNANAEGNALGNSELNERIAALESLVMQLQSQAVNNAQNISANSDAISAAGNVLRFVNVVEGELNGVTGPHFIIEGANVHVRSGAISQSTGEGCNSSSAVDCPTRTGLGNLIVGYNEPRPVA